MITGRNLTVLSIGLNVGDDEPVKQEAKTLAMLADAREYGLEVLAIAYGVSEWEGVAERFVQVLIAHRGNVGPDVLNRDAMLYAGSLALNLDQDAVAVLPFAHDLGRSVHVHYWHLVNSDGSYTAGGCSIADYPVLDAIAGAIRGAR